MQVAGAGLVRIVLLQLLKGGIGRRIAVFDDSRIGPDGVQNELAVGQVHRARFVGVAVLETNRSLPAAVDAVAAGLDVQHGRFRAFLLQIFRPGKVVDQAVDPTTVDQVSRFDREQ